MKTLIKHLKIERNKLRFLLTSSYARTGCQYKLLCSSLNQPLCQLKPKSSQAPCDDVGLGRWAGSSGDGRKLYWFRP